MKNQLRDSEQSGGFSSLFLEPKLRRKLIKLEKQQFYLIDKYLNNSSNEYKNVVADIHELLVSEQIQFTVYAKGFSFNGSHATNLEGIINPNGYSYLEAVSKNFNWFAFDSFAFPSQLTGNIDHWGRIKLQKTETDYALFRRVPRKLTGSISRSGEIKLEVKESDIDAFDGRVTMGKLIANHFNYDDQKNYDFQIKKNFLIDSIDEFRTRITS